MPNPQHRHDIGASREPIQRNKPRLAARNHELAKSVLHRPPNERVMAEDRDGLADRVDLSTREIAVVVRVEIEDALEVLESSPRESYFRHDFGVGRRARFPAARAVM